MTLEPPPSTGAADHRSVGRVIQPITWAGRGTESGHMVCGACADEKACIEAKRCARARDEDYKLPPYMGGTDVV